MKRIVLLLTVLLFPLAAFAQHAMTFDDLAGMKRLGAPKISPDGKWIAYDASSIDLPANYRHSAIYLVPATGGESKRITDGVKQDEGPAWSPDGKTIAFTSNRDGGAPQIYVYDLATQTSRKVSDLNGGASSLLWTPDGSALIAVSDIYPDCGVDANCTKAKVEEEGKRPTKARIIDHLLYRHWKAWQEATRSHILYVPVAAGATGLRDLTTGAFDAPPFSVGGGDEFDISPDGKELVFARNTDQHPEISTNSDLFLVSTAGGEAKRITTRTGSDTTPKYSPDGRWIAWRSQARPGYESDLWELWVYDRQNGTTRRLAQSFNDWIESATWAPDSKSLYFVAPEKGHDVLFEVALADGVSHRLYGKGAVSNVTVARDGKTLYLNEAFLTAPPAIFSMTKVAGGAKSTRLTHDNDALLGTIAMTPPEEVTYAGAEGAQVQAFLLKPPMFDATKKYPAVVLIHGGPQGAWSDGWSNRWNGELFAARGYVVFMPNPRGSSGFGQKFLEGVSGDWGGKPYVDIMNGVDKLAAMPFVDAARIGAAGASYGGYMINWIMGHTDRFKVLVSHDGVFNLSSMYGGTEEIYFPEWEFQGTPWDSPEQYQKWSPNAFVKNFKTPTLVVHGELDYRVPVGEGMQLFTLLQRRGVPSRLLYFPDEGHWVLKPQNSKLWYQTVGEWLDQYLK